MLDGDVAELIFGETVRKNLKAKIGLKQCFIGLEANYEVVKTPAFVGWELVRSKNSSTHRKPWSLSNHLLTSSKETRH